MRRPWSALVLAAGGVLLLVSLYLPWGSTRANFEDYFGSDAGDLHLFGPDEVSAWSAAAGTACAVAALYLVAAGLAVWIRAPRAIHVPIAAPAMLAAYFAVAIAVESRTAATTSTAGVVDFDYARGAYLGIAASVIVVGSTLALRRKALPRSKRLPALALLGGAMAAALLVALLLPWARETLELDLGASGEPSANGPRAVVENAGISASASAVVALAAVFLLMAFWSTRTDAAWKRVTLAAAAALFTLGAFSDAFADLSRAYGAWIALGIALALVPVAILSERPVRLAWVKRLEWRELALAAAPALFLGSLFLPWRNQCFPRSFVPDPRAGHCVSLDGWTLLGTAAAMFASALLVLALSGRRGPVHPLGLAAGVILFAGALAVEVTRGETPPVTIELAYGAVIGLACASVAMVLALPTLRLPRGELREIVTPSVPVALCVAYVAIVLIPPLSEASFDRPTLFFAPISWLTVAGVFVAIRLVESWVARSIDRVWLVFLPLGMLALAVVDLIRLREDLAWGGAVVTGICVALCGLGRIEQRGGFRDFNVPGIFRIDRV